MQRIGQDNLPDFFIFTFYFLFLQNETKINTNDMIQAEAIKEIVRRLDTLGRCL